MSSDSVVDVRDVDVVVSAATFDVDVSLVGVTNSFVALVDLLLDGAVVGISLVSASVKWLLLNSKQYLDFVV